MATRDYHTFFSTPGLWEVPDPTHNDLEAAVGEGNGRNHAAVLTEIIEWNAVSPTVIAVVTEDQPETIQCFHRPRKYQGGGNLQDAMVWVSGDAEDEANFTVLPENIFARTINITVQDDSTNIFNALGGPGAVHDGPHAAGAPLTVDVRIRKASLQPVAWAHRQVQDGPISFAEYHTNYLTPVIGLGDANALAEIQPHINWWAPQVTASPPGAGGGANRFLGRITPTQVLPADRGALTTFGRRRIVSPDMNQLVAPEGPGRLTNAGIHAAIGALDTTLRQQETDRVNRAHDAANKSFTERHGDFKAELMHRMTEVADDASLPQAHQMLARTDKNDRHCKGPKDQDRQQGLKKR